MTEKTLKKLVKCWIVQTAKKKWADIEPFFDPFVEAAADAFVETDETIKDLIAKEDYDIETYCGIDNQDDFYRGIDCCSDVFDEYIRNPYSDVVIDRCEYDQPDSSMGVIFDEIPNEDPDKFSNLIGYSRHITNYAKEQINAVFDALDKNFYHLVKDLFNQ